MKKVNNLRIKPPKMTRPINADYFPVSTQHVNPFDPYLTEMFTVRLSWAGEAAEGRRHDDVAAARDQHGGPVPGTRQGGHPLHVHQESDGGRPARRPPSGTVKTLTTSNPN